MALGPVYNFIKRIILWAASVVSIILYAIAFFSPSHGGFAPLTIAGSRDGEPLVWMGLFKSCARNTTDSELSCTSIDFNPTYDFSHLPENAPVFVLQTPSAIFKVVGSIAFGSLCIFTTGGIVQETIYLWNYEPGKTNIHKGHLVLYQLLHVMGLVTSTIGALNFKMIELYFGQASRHFNEFVSLQGESGPKLVASSGTAVDLGYISCIMVLPAVVFTMVETFYDEMKRTDKSKPGPQREEKGDKLGNKENKEGVEGGEGNKEEDKTEVEVGNGDNGKIEEKTGAEIRRVKGRLEDKNEEEMKEEGDVVIEKSYEKGKAKDLGTESEAEGTGSLHRFSTSSSSDLGTWSESTESPRRFSPDFETGFAGTASGWPSRLGTSSSTTTQSTESSSRSPSPTFPTPQVAFPTPQVAFPTPQVAFPTPQVAFPTPQVAFPTPQIAFPSPQVAFPSPQVAFPTPVAGPSGSASRPDEPTGELKSSRTPAPRKSPQSGSLILYYSDDSETD